MQITDPHFNDLELPPTTRLSVCSICQRFQIPHDSRRDELSATMVYRATGLIAQRANSRVPQTDRPWCTACRRDYFEARQNELLNREVA